MLFFIFIGIIIALFCYFLRSPFSYWQNKGVPCSPASSLFGNITEVIFMKKNLGQVFDTIYREHSSLLYVGVYKVRTPCILLRSTQLIKEVLIQNFNHFHDNEIHIDEKVDPLFGKNPFMARGERWKEIRAQISPFFTAKRIKELVPSMESTSKSLIEYINNRIEANANCFDAKELCMLYAIDNVTRCTLGLDANCFTDPKSKYIKVCNEIFQPSIGSSIQTIIMFVFPTLSNLIQIKLFSDAIAGYFKHIVISTIKYRNENNLCKQDFLNSMLKLQKKLGENVFTIDDITAHISDFYLDGTETSATVLCFILYELSLHQHVKTKLEREINEILQKYDNTLSYEALQQMTYLDQVVNESMRKNPAVTFASRICTETFTFPSPDAKGPDVKIEAGTPIIIPFYSIHHDPKYFPEPQRYDPERFSTTNLEKCSFLAFGEGPRTCIGQRFGITQIKIAIVNIIRNFEFRINAKTVVPYEINPDSFLLGAKAGVWLDFFKK